MSDKRKNILLRATQPGATIRAMADASGYTRFSDACRVIREFCVQGVIEQDYDQSPLVAFKLSKTPDSKAIA